MDAELSSKAMAAYVQSTLPAGPHMFHALDEVEEETVSVRLTPKVPYLKLRVLAFLEKKCFVKFDYLDCVARKTTVASD